MEHVTLQTIADQVGVSRTTVSNAYSRPDQLNIELRERILAVADELGYPGPNPAARSLRRGSSGVIGVLFTDALPYAFGDPYAVEFLRGLSEVTAEEGTGVLLMAWQSAEAAQAAVRDAIVDGFCTFCVPDLHPAIEAMRQRRLPLVITDDPPLPDFPYVGVEDRQACREIAGHVLGLGHRRVAVLRALPTVSDDEGWISVSEFGEARHGANLPRLAGYHDACVAAGMSWDDVPVYQASNERESARRGGGQLLDLHPRPTAIFATSDQMALGLLDAAADRGLDVPGHLSVTGFDDIPGAAAARLTTVRQPMAEKGRTAARLLFASMRGDTPARVIMPYEIIVRGSTAPPSRP